MGARNGGKGSLPEETDWAPESLVAGPPTLDRLAHAIIKYLMVGALAIAGFSVIVGEITTLGLPMVAFAVVALPVAAADRYDVASPWTLVLFQIFVGVALRGIYITLGWPDVDTVERLWLIGRPEEFFFWPSMIVLAGLTSLTIGYHILPEPRKLPRISSYGSHRWDSRRVRRVVVACVIVSLIGLVGFIAATGGLDLSRISAKRGTLAGALARGIESGAFEGSGVWRFLNRFGVIAFLLQIAHYAFSGIKIRGQRLLLVVALAVNATVLPFYASGRTEILWAGVGAAVIWVYARRRVSLRFILLAVLAGLVLFNGMVVLRTGPNVSVVQALRDSNPSSWLDTIVVNRNFVEISKSAHIIDAVPNSLTAEHGATYLSAFLVPIPRTVWSGKPVFDLGPTISRDLYDSTAGVPPGFIGEAYLNFLLIGVILGGFVLGLLIRALYLLVSPHRYQNRSLVLIYAALVLPFVFGVIGSQFAPPAARLGTGAVRLAVVLWAVGAFRESRPSGAAASGG